MTFVLILSLSVCILSSALFSASETALFSLSRSQRSGFAKSKEIAKKQVARLLDSPRDLLITLIVVNTVLNILIQNVVSSLFGQVSSLLTSILFPLALTLTFGEFIPKSLGIANNVAFAPKVAPALSSIKQGISPFSAILLKITSPLSRFLFFFLKKEAHVSKEELRHVLRTSKARGVLGEDEADLMRGYLQLQDANIKGFLRPREEVLTFGLHEPIDRLVHLFVDQECSRIPLYEDEVDNFIGIISSGAFFLHRDSITESKDLIPLIEKPFFVPETTSAQNLLDQMYEEKKTLAIVVDEYGAFSGLIALEDLVEAVVGEIFDRRDEKSRYTRSGDDVIIASGKLELLELATLFDVNLASRYNAVTIGGWLTEQAGDIPKSGYKCHHKGLLFHVLFSDEKRVRRVYIKKGSK